MESKHFKTLILILFINSLVSAQLKMSTLNQLSFEVNLKKDKDTLKIYENNDFKVFYFLDKSFFAPKISKKRGLTTNTNLLFFSKKDKVGIQTLFNYGQSIKKIKKKKFLVTINIDENRFIPYMLILDNSMTKIFLIKYNRIKDLYSDNYIKSVFIQDNKNPCNFNEFSISESLTENSIEQIINDRNNIKNNENKANCKFLFKSYDFFSGK